MVKREEGERGRDEDYGWSGRRVVKREEGERGRDE